MRIMILVGGVLLYLLAAGGGIPAATRGSASLTASPQEVVAGEGTLLTGAGFGPRASGEVTLQGMTVATFRTNERGAFSVVAIVSPETAPGVQQFAARTASASANSRLLVARAPATAAAALSPAPTPNAAGPLDPLPPPIAPPPSGAAAAPRVAPPPSSPPTSGAASPPAPLQTPTPGRGARSPIALGVFVPGALQDPARIDAYTQLVGLPPAAVMWYHDWAHSDFNQPMLEAIVARGAMPLVTWEPWDYTGGLRQPAFALARLAAGDHDDYIRRYARAAAAWGRPLYLRPAHEMNGDWYPWGTAPGNPNGNAPADFVAAWRHLHALFRQEGATNVRWVWSPNVADPTVLPFESLYPGDDYVDWVGVVGYNWGTSQSWSGWNSMPGLFGPTYDVLTALTTKPIIITEIASSEVGGDKAAWIRQSLLSDIPTRFPRVRAVIWFNANQEADWQVDTSPASLAAFRRVVASPIYQGRLP